MNKKLWLVVALILLVGILLAFLLLRKEEAKISPGEHSGDQIAEEIAKGPHGGRLLSKDNLQLEITIFERGVPPQYRVYAYQNGKPIDPAHVDLEIELNRLGGRVDEFGFQPKEDYLLGDKVVEEPHSFDVKVQARYKNRGYFWQYDSYEGRVTMTPEAIRSSGIGIEIVGPAKIESTTVLPGEVVLNPDRVTHLIPRFDGVVSVVTASLGDHVRRGQVLATIESGDFAEAKRQFVEAEHKLEYAKKSYDREQMLWDKRITSEQEYLKMQHEFEEASIQYQTALQKLQAVGMSASEIAAAKDFSRYSVRAPVDSVVIEKNIAAGQPVQSEEEIFVLADLSL